MRLHSKAILTAAAIFLAACSGGAGGFGGGGAGTGAGAGLGDAGDPTTAAYFQSAIGDRVLFVVDQHVLTEEAKSVLNKQAVWLMDNVEFTAVVEGHADEQGTSAYNLALSGRRANSVIEYLVSRGVASGRLQSLPLGKERPIAICSEEACYSQNRRAVTVVAAGGLS